MPEDKLPIPQFAAKIKAKYPEYKDVNDTLLVQRIVAKYPDYADQVDMSGVGGEEPSKKKELGGMGSLVGSAATPSGATSSEDKIAAVKAYVHDRFGGNNIPKEIPSDAIVNQVFPVEKHSRITDKKAEEEALRRFSSPARMNEFSKTVAPNIEISKDPIGDKVATLEKEQEAAAKLFDPMSDNRTQQLNELLVKEKQKQLVKEYYIKDGDDATAIVDDLYKGNGGQVAPLANQPFAANAASIDQVPLEQIKATLPNTLTAQIAFDKYAKKRTLNELWAKSGNIEQLINEYAGTDISKETEASKGKIIDAFLNSPEVQEKAQKDGRFNNAVTGLKMDLPNISPSYVAQQTATKISQSMEDNRLSSWFYENSDPNTVQKAIDKLKEKGEWSALDENIYNNSILPDVVTGKGDKWIKTTDLLHSIGYGLYEGAEGVEATGRDVVNKLGGSMLDPKGNSLFQNLGLMETEQDRAKRVKQFEESRTNVEAKGLMSNLRSGGGHFLGFTAPMILAGAAGVPEAATMVAMFEGKNHDRAVREFPNNPGKQNVYTLLTTGVDVMFGKLLHTDKAAASAKTLFARDVKDIIVKLSNNEITEAAAKETLTRKLFNYTGKIIKGNFDTSKALALFQIGHNTIDAAFGLRNFSLENEINDVVKAAPSNFLAGTFLSGIGGFKGSNRSIANELNRLAENPDMTRELIKDDPEKLKNFDYLLKVREQLADKTISEQQRNEFAFRTLQKKVLQEKAKEAADKVLAKEYEDKAKAVEIQQKATLDPDMGIQKIAQEFYENDLLPKGVAEMFETDGKFTPTKVGGVLKYIAQQANGFTENWEVDPHGRKGSMENVPEEFVEMANERWAKEIESAKLKAAEKELGQTEELLPEDNGLPEVKDKVVGSGVGGDVETTTNVLNETQKSNPTVWQKIKDAFNNLVSKTKEYLNKAKGTQYEELAKVLGDHLKNVRTSTIEDLKGVLGEKIGGQLKKLHILVNSGKGDLQIFFHEAMHHITFEKISQYLNNNHENLKPHEIDAIQNLQRIFEDSKAKIAAMKIKTSAYYGFTNLHEFISEAFSNPEFQRLLKELPSEGKSPTVFKAFLDAIAKLMGLKDATILNDIFHHTEKLLDKPKSENEGIAELYHQAKAEGTHPDFVKAVEQSLPTQEVKPTTNETNIKSNDIIGGSELGMLQSWGNKQADTISPEPIPAEEKGVTEKEVGTTGEAAKEKVSKSTYQSRAKKLYKDIGEIDDPQDATGLVLSYLAGGGKINEVDIDAAVGRVKRATLNTGAKEKRSNEVRARDYASKDAPTMDEIVHSIWDELPEEIQNKVSTEDLKNEMLAAVTGHETRFSAATAFRDRYVITDVRANMTEAEAKALDDKAIAQRKAAIGELPENQTNELLKLLENYEDEYGNVDWDRLEKDTQGFSPEILSLSPETQKALDGIIEKNISEAGIQPDNLTDKNGIGKEKTTAEQLPQEKITPKDLADKIRGLKVNISKLSGGGLQSNPLGLPVLVWNGAMDIIAKAVEAGGEVAEAVKRGINYIQKNHRGQWDKKGFNDQVLKELGLRGIRVNGEDLIVKSDPKTEREFAETVNGWYSDLEQSVLDAKASQGTAAEWVKFLGKSDEAKWTGLNDWLSQQKGTVSKKDIQNFLKDNRIQVVEVVKGEVSNFTKEDISDVKINQYGAGNWVVSTKKDGTVEFPLDKADDKAEAIEYALEQLNYDNKLKRESKPKFQKYQLEGEKENYKEVLVTMPNKGVKPIDKWAFYEREGYTKEEFEQAPKEFQKKLFDKWKAETSLVTVNKSEQFRSSHFDEPNILVHLRMNTRTDADGKKVLFLEEIQGDFPQEYRKQQKLVNEYIDTNAAKVIEAFKKKGLLEVICP